MKTRKIIISILAILFIVSCGTDYRILTTLERNGKVHREVYSFKNQSGMKNDTSKNPFLFNIYPDWKITHFDDTVIKYNFFGDTREFRMKISKDANSIEQYSREIQCDEENLSFAAPEESLVKKFRWFYTYYSFETVYKKLKYEVPIPISNYLNEDEQLLWTQGNMSNYRVSNGSEMYNYLNEINDKFTEWCSRNFFEISIESIKKLTIGYDLDSDKEIIYKEIRKAKINDFDITPKEICPVLDSFYKTTYFSKLYKTNEKTVEKDVKTATAIISIICNVISYELVIPDKLIKTDAPIINSDTLIWKVDGMRLLFDDYTFTAEYRVVNVWAFVIGGLVLILAVGSVVVLWKKR